MGQPPDLKRDPVTEAELSKVHNLAWNALTGGGAIPEHQYRGGTLLLLEQILTELRALNRRATPPAVSDPLPPPVQPALAQRRRGSG